MKISGWNRIGIVASVLWILAAGIYTFNAERNAELTLAANAADYAAAKVQQFPLPPGATAVDPYAEFGGHADTIPPPPAGYTVVPSGALFAAETSPISHSDARITAALVAFVPVMLSWAFCYLIVFLTGWIKRGFQANPQPKETL